MERDVNPHMNHSYPQENWIELDVIDGHLEAITPTIRQGRENYRNTDYEWKSRRGGNSTQKAPHVPIIEASKNQRPFKRSLKAEGHFALQNRQNALDQALQDCLEIDAEARHGRK